MSPDDEAIDDVMDKIPFHLRQGSTPPSPSKA